MVHLSQQQPRPRSLRHGAVEDRARGAGSQHQRLREQNLPPGSEARAHALQGDARPRTARRVRADAGRARQSHLQRRAGAAGTLLVGRQLHRARPGGRAAPLGLQRQPAVAQGEPLRGRARRLRSLRRAHARGLGLLRREAAEAAGAAGPSHLLEERPRQAAAGRDDRDAARPLGGAQGRAGQRLRRRRAVGRSPSRRTAAAGPRRCARGCR